jgi:hypothetical protein
VVGTGNHRPDHLDCDCLLARAGCRPEGHSFIGYFLLSLLFFPLSLIMAYAVQDRSGVAYGAG